MRLFDIALVPILCGGCGEEVNADNEALDDSTCLSCWVNPECPFGCNERHDAPSFRERDGSEWVCPQTGDSLWYHGPNRFADRQGGAWYEYESVLVIDTRGVRWWIDRDDAYYCDGCENYIHESRYAGDDRCDACYESHDDYDCDCDECQGEACGPPQNSSCNYCSQPTTHWNPITEVIYCGTHAEHDPAVELIPALIAA